MKAARCPQCEGTGYSKIDLTGHLVSGTLLNGCWGCSGYGFIDCKTAMGIELVGDERYEALLSSQIGEMPTLT